MKVAILQCDNVLDKFQGEFGNYPGMVQRMFDGVETSLSFDVFDCKQLQYPPDYDAYDFCITTGSKSSAYDDEPWIKRLIEEIRELDAREKKLIGICFGHQLIAMARGGVVERSEKGWGIGIANNDIISTPEWMSESQQQLDILVSHQDQVTQLAGETQVIARSDFCSNFVVQWGGHFLSIQGHPEWRNEYSKALINNRRNIIPAPRIEAGLASLAQQPDNALFTRWVMDFVQR